MYGTAEQLKRALALLLTILMLVSVLPVSSFAETGSGDPPPAGETPEASASPEPTATPVPEPTAIPKPDYTFPQAEVKLADILDELKIDLGVNYELDLVVDSDLVVLSHKVLKDSNRDAVTLTAKASFKYVVLTLQKSGVIQHTISLGWTEPVATATPEATEEPTATPEATEEPTATPEATEEPTATPEATEEPTATSEATEEPTATPEATEEPTPTPVVINVPEPSETPEATPEATDEPAPTATPEATPETTEEPEPTATPEATPEATEEPEPTATPEASPEATDEPEPSATPEATEEPEPTATPISINVSEPSASPEATEEAEPTAEATPEATEEPEPSATPEATPEATDDPDPTASPEATPEATDEPEPSETPEATPEATDEPEPSETPEATPEATDEPEPSETPEATPEATEEPEPTETPEPTATPEPEPTATPEPEPTATPEPAEVAITAEGKSYSVQVAYAKEVGIPMDGTALQVIEITPDSDRYAAYMEESADKLGVSVEDLKFARAFDIKIVDAKDESLVYEPQAPVRVSITLPGTDLSEFAHVDVLHFGAPRRRGAKSAAKSSGASVDAMESEVNGETVIFTAGSFSVFVVAAHEEGTVVNPRVMFHFISNGAIEQNANNIVYYQGSPYSFINKNNDTQTTQILSNGESLELIADPENATTSGGTNYFYGWYVVDTHPVEGTTDENGIDAANNQLYYTWPAMPQAVTFESPISINGSSLAIGANVSWELNGTSGTGKVDKDGNVHVFLAPVFEKYNFIDFMLHPRDNRFVSILGSGNSLMTRKLVALGSANAVEVKVSDIRSTSTDPVHLVFTGWEYYAGTSNDPDSDPANWVSIQTVDYTGAEITDPNRDGVYHTFTRLSDTTSIRLYPIYIEARWVDFVAGVSGSGATYVASRFRESWGDATPSGTQDDPDKNVFNKLDVSTRPGYEFEGWYAFAVTDPKTGKITNLTDPADVTISYVNVNNKFATTTVTVNTTAVKVAEAHKNSQGQVIDATINNTGTWSIKDNGNGTYSLANDGSGQKLFETSNGKLRFFDPLDRLTLHANWTPKDSMLTIVYWTEDAQDIGYTPSDKVEDTYSANRAYALTTEQLNDLYHTKYNTAYSPFASGYEVTFEALEDLGLLSTDNLSGAVPGDEIKFYELVSKNGKIGYDSVKQEDITPEDFVVIDGDGRTVYNVYYNRMEFTLVFHIGRDGYVKNGGHQKTDAGWDGNWIEFMYRDTKVLNLGYSDSWNKTNGRNPADSVAGVYSMTYKPGGTADQTLWETYTSQYETNAANVMGNYLPSGGYTPGANTTNVYVIKAKYGAYIGDKWPTPVNPYFTFTDPQNASRTMYIWAAYYGSLYCRIANERSTVGNAQGANPDINGVYEYMSKELCSNRAGTDIINTERVHHLVAYYGPPRNEDRYKLYHVLFEAIDGTYDPAATTTVPGETYEQYLLTTWSEEHTAGDKREILGHSFFESETKNIISNLQPQFQLSDAMDGYKLIYSCYNGTKRYDPGWGHDVFDIYFFYQPLKYSLTFMYEDRGPWTDEYYYTQSLEHALDCIDHDHSDPTKKGYEFKGWYTNEAGEGEEFRFDTTPAHRMPSHNVVLYPRLDVIQYMVKIDPNGGVIDHINYNVAGDGITANTYQVNGTGHNTSQATYFTADYGTPIGEYTVQRPFIELTDKEKDSTDALHYYDPTQSGQEWYYYLNAQFNDTYDGDWGLSPDLRNAVYMTEDQLRKYYNYYRAVATNDIGYYTGVTVLGNFDAFAAAYTSYPDHPYRKVTSENYTFMGWYQVFDDGTVSSMPYNFNDPIMSDITLRANWRLDGGYYVEYNPYYVVEESGQVQQVFGQMGNNWTDPHDPSKELYADQTRTHVLQGPTNVTSGWIFRGWYVARKTGATIQFGGIDYPVWEPLQRDGNNNVIYYQPGDTLIVDSALVSEERPGVAGKIVHMHAYYEPEATSYRRPDVTNLILDANDTYGRGFVNTTDQNTLPALSGPGSQIINTTDHKDSQDRPTQILLGDFQSNIALHLYRYATTKTFDGVTGTKFFTSDDGYLLIGFDENEDPDHPTTNSAYIPAYAADAVIAVTRQDNKTLYAMWEPMVYVTFVNTTDEPITVNLTGTGSTTVSIVNQVTGEFDREATMTQITIPAKSSGGQNGQVKIVLPRAAVGTDSITARATNTHLRKKMSVSGSYRNANPTTPYGQGSTEIKYGQQVTYTGTLVTDAEGVIVTYTEEDDRQVVFNVNGGTWTETSTDYAHADGTDLYSIDEDVIDRPTNFPPKDPTLTGKVFIGWTTNADIAACTDFSGSGSVTFGAVTITPGEGDIVLDKVRNEHLWDPNRTPPFGQILYAVWSDAVTVRFDILYNNGHLHSWDNVNNPVTIDPGAYVFYQSSSTERYITYTLAKGDRVMKPGDPTVYAEPNTNGWNFIKWLKYNSSVDSFRYSSKEPNNVNLITYNYDFAERVVSDVTLITSWTKSQPQTFTFTVENHVENGSPNKEFEYTIEISDVKRNKSNQVKDPTQQWGSITTTLKNNETYTVIITVLSVKSNVIGWNFDGYSVTVDVIDRSGNVIKSGHVLYYDANSNAALTTDYKYTLSINQTGETGYDTTVTTNGQVGTFVFGTDSSTRKFTFVSRKNGTTNNSTMVNEFAPDQNAYVAGENNSLTVIFTNTGEVYPSPTGVSMAAKPFGWMVLAGLALMMGAALPVKRRKREEL